MKHDICAANLQVFDYFRYCMFYSTIRNNQNSWIYLNHRHCDFTPVPFIEIQPPAGHWTAQQHQLKAQRFGHRSSAVLGTSECDFPGDPQNCQEEMDALADQCAPGATGTDQKWSLRTCPLMIFMVKLGIVYESIRSSNYVNLWFFNEVTLW